MLDYALHICIHELPRELHHVERMCLLMCIVGVTTS